MRFDELNLNEAVLMGVDAMNFKETTPIQAATIPIILEGKDLIACAQTGTGKTAAYILPLLHKLTTEKHSNKSVNAIIMAPTRELAQQIDMQFEGFSYFVPVSTLAVYGGGDGMTWDIQKNALLNGVDIIVATPGRLLTLLEMHPVDLSGVRYFILDEADRMLDMGFFDDIMKVVKKLPENRQSILFSATMPPKIQQLAKKILCRPEEIKLAVSKPNDAIMQAAYICHEGQKMALIRELFGTPVKSKSIIFSSSKIKVKDLAYTLKMMKFSVAAMHSDLEQSEREQVLLDFKNGKIAILVATDIVARGIDIEDIGMVLNYDVPRDAEDYIHRIGRSARAGADGLAVTFVSEREQGKFHRIEQFLEREIYKIPLSPEIGKGPKYSPQAFEHQEKRKVFRKKGSNRQQKPHRNKPKFS
ncbi:MAG: DEAD/DEAH box helicase [Candidatus Symbiothrix sp.]|jgi:superfamily II DNA/RNA helicase|nr:DEAD/DEAH box helicase [Candidatus Symbiothrix sp.]